MDLAFENWVANCFDPPATETLETDYLSNPGLCEYLTRLLENPEPVAARYSRNQIAKGIGFIFGRETQWFLTIRSRDVPRDAQVRCYRGMKTLYQRLFDPLCSPDSLVESMDKLESAVYMIWDMDCVEGAAMWEQFDYLVGACFEVLDAALACRSAACKMSGLHALGHLQEYHPAEVERLIKPFLSRSDIPHWMRVYAEGARTGKVL